MMFDADKMRDDVDTYGVYAYEDFSEYLTKEQFEAFNVKYMKVAVGKGGYTYEGILGLIEEFLKQHEAKKHRRLVVTSLLFFIYTLYIVFDFTFKKYI